MFGIDYYPWDASPDRADRPCVRDDVTELTYTQLSNRVETAASHLVENGVRAADVIAVMLPNRVELLVAIMAAWRIGAAATPVNPALTEAEARYQITDARAILVVVEDETSPIAGVATRTLSEFASTSVAVGHEDMREPRPDDLALLIYTSGSTGRPKGVELTHSNLQYMASAMAAHFELTSDDHSLLILPLFHVNAICVSVLAPLTVGGQVSITGKFSPSRFFDDVRRLRPTYFSAVPTIYALLAAQSKDTVAHDTSSLRFAVCGAAPISQELLDRAESTFGLPIVEGYGLTEGTCASACNPVTGIRKLGTVGPALAGQTIVIADENGTLLPPGAVGEVLIAGPNVMRGYLARPDDTARTLVDGWLHTGDVGRLDDDGYLTLVDRIKDMIIRGGENLYPKEIENALATHTDVLEAAVVGAPDEVYGEVPVAYVVTYPNATVSSAELVDHLRDRIARVKLPVAIHIVEVLPRNPVGKIDKPGLRATLRTLTAEPVP